MRKREREKLKQEIRELLERASMELNLISHDINRDFVTPKGAAARIRLATDTAQLAINKYRGAGYAVGSESDRSSE